MKQSLQFATLWLLSAITLCAQGKNTTFNLQDAIDDASRGDTIVIPNGTYTQPIIIDKNLTLDGKDATLEVVSDLPAIKIDTSKLVTLKNLEIRYKSENPNPRESDNIAAIYCEGGDLLIENSSVKWTRKGWNPNIYAVFATDQSTLQIKGSLFDGFGIYIMEKSEGCVEDCLIINSEANGIWIRRKSSGVLRRNIIARSKWMSVCLGYRAETVIDSNLIINGKLSGIESLDSTATICNNLIIGTESDGIKIGVGDTEMANNVILRSGKAGVSIHPKALFDIEENVIVDNNVGFRRFSPDYDGKGTIDVNGKNLVYRNKTQSKGVDLSSKTIEVNPEFTDADAGLFSLESREAGKMGLTDSEIIQTLWKKWEDGAKN